MMATDVAQDCSPCVGTAFTGGVKTTASLATAGARVTFGDKLVHVPKL